MQQCGGDVGRCGVLHGHHVRADVDEPIRPVVGVGDHEVDVDEGVRPSAQRGDEVRPEQQLIGAVAVDQWRVLDRDEAAKLVGATNVLGGAFTEHCALVHPGKLVRGLAELVERMGAVIFEGTPVEHVCTTQLIELGLDHPIAFNDLRKLRIHAQVTADKRLVFGGRGAPYHVGSAVSQSFEIDPRVHAKIRETMLGFFPSLADVPITHRWGGPLGVPRDWHPSVGLDRTSGLAWAGPYVADGVATSNLAGRVLCNLLLERNEPINALPIVNHRSPQWEVEPFRWLGVNAGLLAASTSDVEERFTRRPSRISHLLERLTGAH
jgi:glycine/D-amino acid oxidase-like deaminating enzyme